MFSREDISVCKNCHKLVVNDAGAWVIPFVDSTIDWHFACGYRTPQLNWIQWRELNPTFSGGERIMKHQPLRDPLAELFEAVRYDIPLGGFEPLLYVKEEFDYADD